MHSDLDICTMSILESLIAAIANCRKKSAITLIPSISATDCRDSNGRDLSLDEPSLDSLPKPVLPIQWCTGVRTKHRISPNKSQHLNREHPNLLLKPRRYQELLVSLSLNWLLRRLLTSPRVISSFAPQAHSGSTTGMNSKCIR